MVPLSNWRLSVMFPPTSTIAPVTAWTMPGASAHTTVRTNSFSAVADSGGVREEGVALMRQV